MTDDSERKHTILVRQRKALKMAMFKINMFIRKY